MDEGRKRTRVMAAILTVLTWKEPTICSAAQRKAYLQSTLSMLTNAVTVPFALTVTAACRLGVRKGAKKKSNSQGRRRASIGDLHARKFLRHQLCHESRRICNLSSRFRAR